MRSKSPQLLGDVLAQLIQRSGLSRGIDDARAIEAWDQIISQPIRAVTQDVYVRDKTLFVKITNSTWRAELHLEKSAWRDRINRHVGKKVLKGVVFR